MKFFCLLMLLVWESQGWAISPKEPFQSYTYADCKVEWNARELVLSNRLIYRSWQIQNGLLVNRSLKDQVTGKEKLAATSPNPSPAPEFEVKETCRGTVITADTSREVVVDKTALRVTVRSEYPTYTLTTHYKIYPETAAVSSWISIAQQEQISSNQVTLSVKPTGFESADQKQTFGTDLNELLVLNHVHQELGIIQLMDQTDVKDNLVQVNTYLLTNVSANDFQANLFYLEDQFSHEGILFLKEAPLPYARPVKTSADLRQNAGQFAFSGLGAGEDTFRQSYPFTILLYQNGAAGRTKVLQHYQRQFRNYDAARDEFIWHSIWGDRNRDGRMKESFLKKEMDLNAQLGINHLYFIDGWQKGPSINSVDRDKGGLWDNQWSRPDYWEPNPERFPNGFDALVQQAKDKGFKIGMWYNPDRTNDYANWKRDTDVLLQFHRRFGANYFKYDGVVFTTKLGESNLMKAMHRVVEETGGQAGIEIDITAGLRTGYFAAMSYGTLFLENRYTDWRKYYPHTTLRNLWQLSHFVDPRRMRIEFLNPERNQDKYPGDPLAPARYPKDYGLAVTLFAKPMAWFETSGLSDSTRQAFAALLKAYKPHQSAIHQGTIYPVGSEPTGFSWTGFQSVTAADKGYVVIFRELNEAAAQPFALHLPPGKYRFEALAGAGKDFRVTVAADRKVPFRLDHPQTYGLYYYQKNQ